MECADMKRHVKRDLDCDGKGLIVWEGRSKKKVVFFHLDLASLFHVYCFVAYC